MDKQPRPALHPLILRYPGLSMAWDWGCREEALQELGVSRGLVGAGWALSALGLEASFAGAVAALKRSLAGGCLQVYACPWRWWGDQQHPYLWLYIQ